MQIKVLCREAARFNEIRRAAIDKDPEAEVSGGVWRVEDLPTFIDGVGPDVLIVDPATSDSLHPIETLTQRRPDIEILLVSQDTSAQFLMQAMRAGVREVLPAPADDAALKNVLGRILLKRNQLAGRRGDGKVLAFISCKGGAGATFLASNLAYALTSERGRRVALIDLNLQFGDAVMFVSDQRPPSNLAEVAREIHRLDASLLSAAMLEVRPNFHVLASPEDPAHAPDVRREHVEAILRLARRNYDFVVVDVARSLDVLTLQALDMADLIFPVVQLTLPFVRDSKRLADAFRSLDYPAERIRMIVNRFSKGGEITVADVERAAGQRVYWSVPNSYMAAASSVNLGVPIVQGQPSDAISRELRAMAADLAPEMGQAAHSTGWLSKVFGNRKH